MPEDDILAVIGAGATGQRLALSASLAGYLVRLCDPDEPALERALASLRDEVAAAVARGELTAEDRQRALDGVLATADRAEAVRGAAVILEAAGGRVELVAGAAGTEETLERARALVARAGAAPPPRGAPDQDGG